MSRPRRFAVPAILCGITLMGVIADTWLVRAARRGNGVASDPDYYERALAWDDTMEASAAAAHLGVTLDAQVTRTGPRDARLCVRLLDAAGLPLRTSAVSSTASANLCPKQRAERSMEPVADAYCAQLADACPGVWVIDVRAEVAGEVIAARARADLGESP